MRWELLVVAILCICGCDRTVTVGESGSPHCNVENCNTLVDACHMQFAAEPNVSLCAIAANSRDPSDFDYAASLCPAACNAQHSGDFLKCMVDNRDQCGNRDQVDRIIQLCGHHGEAQSDPGCIDACDRDREQCDKACPTAAFRECLDCSARCGLVLASCHRQCYSPSN